VRRPQAPLAQRDLDIDVCNNFIGVGVLAKNVTEKSTSREIGGATRRNFPEKGTKGGSSNATGGGERAGSASSAREYGRRARQRATRGRVDAADDGQQLRERTALLLTGSKVAREERFLGRRRSSPPVVSRSEADGLARSIACVRERCPRAKPPSASSRPSSVASELLMAFIVKGVNSLENQLRSMRRCGSSQRRKTQAMDRYCLKKLE
jgi:hypothetical protein